MREPAVRNVKSIIVCKLNLFQLNAMSPQTFFEHMDEKLRPSNFNSHSHSFRHSSSEASNKITHGRNGTTLVDPIRNGSIPNGSAGPFHNLVS